MPSSSSSSSAAATDDPAPPVTGPSATEAAADANGGSSPPRKKQGKPPAADLRFHAAIAAALAVAAVALSQVGPSFRTVLNFFWPLFLSTGVFLAAVVLLRIISPPQADGDAADKAGSDLMDFVAGGSVGGGQEEHQVDGPAEEVVAKDRKGSKVEEPGSAVS